MKEINNNSDYNKSTQTAIVRRSLIKSDDKSVIVESEYTIGKKKYIVNSYYIASGKSADEGIKRLLKNNIDKAS